MDNEKKAVIKFKSHIVLPLIIILSLVTAICLLAVEEFTDGLSPIVIYLYFSVAVLYTFLSVYDLFVNKEREKKAKVFITVLIALAFVSEILYLVFYLIAKGR